MRKDETGRPCPGTLGEYRDRCATLRADSEAVAYLDREIAKTKGGREHVVGISDLDIRQILIPRLYVKAGEWRGGYECPCGTEIVHLGAPREPRAGDAMICNHCGAVARYGPDLVLVPCDVDTLDTLTKAAVLQARAIIARRGS